MQKSDQWISRFAISVFYDGNHVAGNLVMSHVVLVIKLETSFASEENIKSVQKTAWDRKN